MARTNEEKSLLKKLADGILDGMVGDERVYHGYKDVYCGKYIKDGVPISYREGESTRFFNGKENERIPGKRTEERYIEEATSAGRTGSHFSLSLRNGNTHEHEQHWHPHSLNMESRCTPTV